MKMSSYKVSEPSALKFLKANGAVVDENGNVVSDDSDYWKKVYDQAEPKVAKYLHADGTIDENPGGGGGSGAELEDNHQTTIDVSAYTEPVEIKPTVGKDGMKKVTVTLSNIPSGGDITLNTLLSGLGSSENGGYGVMFLDTNQQPIAIEDFETADLSQVAYIYEGTEYGGGTISISNLTYNKEGNTLTYINSYSDEQTIYLNSGVTGTVDYPLIDYLTKSFA